MSDEEEVAASEEEGEFVPEGQDLMSDFSDLVYSGDLEQVKAFLTRNPEWLNMVRPALSLHWDDLRTGTQRVL